jgi:hypothetical protein
MSLAFDLNNVRNVEFGIGRDTDAGRRFDCIVVDRDVQGALREMAETTWQILSGMGRPERYQPSEKHSGQEYLTLPLGDNLAASMRELHQANNLALDASALNDPSQAFAYFARLSDAQGRRLTALRRATQFKGVLRSRLVRLVTNALKLVEDRVFKLDADFDLLIDGRHVHILRPAAFEFAGQLQQAVMDAVPTNIAALQTDLGFVNFDAIGTYAAQHPRAARYLASIRSAEETQNISQSKLKALCKRTGVTVVERDGKLNVEEGHVMGFLEVLDRRRYELELVDGQPELYRAPSRQRIESAN